MNLIKHDELLFCGQFGPHNFLPVGKDIPVQIGRVVAFCRAQQAQRKCRFAHLPRATEKNHFFGQICEHRGCDVTIFDHKVAWVAKSMASTNSAIYENTH